MAGPSKPANKPKGKGIAPSLDQTATGIETTAKAGRVSNGGKAMNFNVDPEFFTDYKTFATMNNLSMKELLERSFAEYKQKHG
ncbi:hypothetical protein ACJ8QF_24005 [Serratia sp. CY81684]|uniref:hypothetical protein n=1 Tax=Serratia sp. CY81684 TaxID=3383686 RepID=UPI003F9FF3AB